MLLGSGVVPIPLSVRVKASEGIVPMPSFSIAVDGQRPDDEPAPEFSIPEGLGAERRGAVLQGQPVGAGSYLNTSERPGFIAYLVAVLVAEAVAGCRRAQGGVGYIVAERRGTDAQLNASDGIARSNPEPAREAGDLTEPSRITSGAPPCNI